MQKGRVVFVHYRTEEKINKMKKKQVSVPTSNGLLINNNSAYPGLMPKTAAVGLNNNGILGGHVPLTSQGSIVYNNMHNVDVGEPVKDHISADFNDEDAEVCALTVGWPCYLREQTCLALCVALSFVFRFSPSIDVKKHVFKRLERRR